jgi:iron(III) transport system substrate-binding protein
MLAKARQEGQVVITGGDAAVIAKELNGFRQKYPFITVKPLAASPPDIVTRVTSESQAGNLTVDVLEIDDSSAEQLARRSLLDKQDYPNLADYKSGTAPSSGLYATLGINPYLQVVYNTDLVKPADVPKSWDDITDPKWQGKVIMARSGNSLVARMASLWGSNGQLDWNRASDFIQKIGNQKPKIASNFIAATDQVAQREGSVLWMAPGNPPALLGVQGEAHIDGITFTQIFGGYLTLVTPKGIPHPGAAWLLVDYLTSPEGQFEASDRMLSIQPLNQKAQVGRLGKWVADRGGNLQNIKVQSPEDSAKEMTDDVLKQSASLYNKALGIQ